MARISRKPSNCSPRPASQRLQDHAVDRPQRIHCARPAAILIQEALKTIRLELTIEKVPGSNWFAQMASKTMPMVIAEFYGWLDYPTTSSSWTFQGGNNSVFNTANYVNPDLDKVIDQARFTRDPEIYKTA